MVDIISKEDRSTLMSTVGSGDTKPEWVLRCALHRMGFRYRLNNKKLPGKPDLVFPKFRAAVFVHGCFWHQHSDCKSATMPKSNRQFWSEKLAMNIERDKRVKNELLELGWKVLVVWECDLLNQTLDVVEKVAFWVSNEIEHLSPLYEKLNLDRKSLLMFAEEKVRYRIDDKRGKY